MTNKLNKKVDIVGLLRTHNNTQYDGRCYTCDHPRAKELTDQLVAALQVEQDRGRMLGYTMVSLFRSVFSQCKKEGTPFERTIYSFKRHLKIHTTFRQRQPS